MDVPAHWETGLQADLQTLAQPGSRALSASAAVALAGHLLQETGYENLGMEPVRVEPVPERGEAAARVRFEAPDRVWGQRVAVDVEVSAMGQLLALTPRFNHDADPEDAELDAPDPADGAEPDAVVGDQDLEENGGGRASLSIDGELSWAPVVKFGMWVVLGGLFLVLFVRRLAAQAVDLRAALVDAAAAGLAVSVYPLLLVPLMRQAYPFEGIQFVLVVVIGTLLWVAGAGLLALVASGVSDSLMRARRRDKLDALALVRQGRVLNRRVGLSLVRGALAAAALLGVAAALWAAAAAADGLRRRRLERRAALAFAGAARADADVLVPARRRDSCCSWASGRC